jgi:hypothetical protein
VEAVMAASNRGRHAPDLRIVRKRTAHGRRLRLSFEINDGRG